MSYFEVLKSVQPPSSSPLNRGENKGRARNGLLHTVHGDIHTPTFLPIGTKGAVKSITSEELKFWGAEIILANTYHLWQRPGDALIYKAGGLHKFMNFKGPIFTDSGGFQVYSLAKMRKVTETGVLFSFDLDGREEVLTPEKSVQIQANLGSDIALVLDDFPGFPFEYQKSKQSVDLTKRWTERAIREHQKIITNSSPINKEQKLWGIVQGASFEDLRKIAAKDMVEFGFEGFAIGGVAVGEPAEEMLKAVEYAMTGLPENAPKHLLGVGTPYDIVQAVARGCDMFDCVIPTREARHGRVYIAAKDTELPLTPSFEKRGNQIASSSSLFKEDVERSFIEGYSTIDIRLEKYREDFTPVDNACNCYLCLNHTRAYLRHLFATGEPLSIRLATMHNLRFYLNLMEKIRHAINYEYFEEMAANYKEI